MAKTLKIWMILIMVFFLLPYFSQAETTNLYNDIENEQTSNTFSDTDSTKTTENDSDSENSTEPIDDLDFFDDSYARTTSSPTTNNQARMSTVSSISEANLGLNNILCVILIALGILMILLAIAILIRLKK